MNGHSSSYIDKNSKSKAMRTVTLTMLLFCLLPILINSVAIAPLRAITASDIAISSTLLDDILKYVYDFLALVAYSVTYSLLIFSVFVLDRRHSVRIMVLHILTFFIAIPVNMLMDIPLYGSLGTTDEIIIVFFVKLTDLIFVLLQLLLVYLFALKYANRYLRKIAFASKTAKKAKKAKRGDNVILTDIRQEELSVFPINKLFDFKNPILSSALAMSIVIVAVKIITRIINDISWGAPTSLGEVAIMAVYYLSDIVYGAVAYFVAIFVFTSLYDKLKRKAQSIPEISEEENKEAEEADASPADNI